MYETLRHHVVRARVHAQWFIRDLFPNRKVQREVLGVTLTLPWSHRLPDFISPYGENLVDLARELAEADGERVTFIDVGANVGDSTKQIMHACDARALCVEADPYYLEYLRLNVGDDPDVTIVEALLTPEESTAATTAVRVGGTTRFEEGEVGDALASISPAALRAGHPDFERLRLIKSDTDGYDVKLVPALVEAWADSATKPALFFEYDHILTRKVGNDPLAVWPRLEALGYRDVGVWDNGGVLVGRTTVSEIAGKAAVLDEVWGKLNHPYWDVAVIHADDATGQQALERIAPAAKPL